MSPENWSTLLTSVSFIASDTDIVNSAARHLGALSLTSPIPTLGQPHIYPPPNPESLDAFIHGNVPPDGPARHVWEQHREAIARGIQAESQRIPYVLLYL